VTSYYDLEPVDARTARFVVGSDVLGPMGAELVPFATDADAEEFRMDHAGSRTVRFGEVTRELLTTLG
jgi:nitrous oxide reductase accessory protein NosL